jgi:hypothetical protein
LQYGQKLTGIISRRSRKLDRKDEKSPKNCICRGETCEIMRRGMERKEKPRQMG